MASSGAAVSTAPSLAWRACVFVGLALGEILLASSVFSLATGLPEHLDPVAYANWVARFGALAFPAFLLCAWPIRHQILAAWRVSAPKHNFAFSVAVNLSLFSGLMLLRFAFSQTAGVAWHAAAAYSALLLATGGSLALLAAPFSFWWKLLTIARLEIALALVGGCIAMLAGWLSQGSWTIVAGATLDLSHWLLTLYEPQVGIDEQRRILHVGDFRVQIGPPCSGYEGAGLVTAFVTIYLYVFRRDLRFPNALLLFPIGIATIWILNSVRIAALVSIGAHISPDIAVGGFHSEGGWIMFLLVTAGIIAMSQKLPFFVTRVARPAIAARPQAGRSGRSLVAAYLAPFMAMMAAGIVASAFAPHDQWLYPLKVVGIGAVLWWFRDVYAGILTRLSPISVLTGVVVGMAWIATEPATARADALGNWLGALPASMAGLWLTLRAVGSIVCAPLAEELAFRGYLHRVLIRARFETVAPGQFSVLAFVVSTLAFGLMHQRWASACLAGAVYALLMYRTNRLSDPIAAHMASNATIVLWALANEQWTLL